MDVFTVDKINYANWISDDFVSLYFKTVDKKRHLISKMHLETAALVWHGTGIIGNEKIQEFFFELPLSNHIIDSYHAEPLRDVLLENQESVLIQVNGFIKFTKDVSTPFTQNCILTCHAEEWKIVSNCFRMHRPIQVPVASSSGQN